MSLSKWKEAKIRLHDATKYLSLIGRTTSASTVAKREGEGATAGALTKFEVKTEINFQPYDGAKNYHQCAAFDAALSAVVRKRWSEISAEAMALLHSQEREAAKAAEDELLAMLAEIEAAHD